MTTPTQDYATRAGTHIAQYAGGDDIDGDSTRFASIIRSEVEPEMEKVKQENAELRKAVRRHSIGDEIGMAGLTKICEECNWTWETGKVENHAPGCLAAPIDSRTQQEAGGSTRKGE